MGPTTPLEPYRLRYSRHTAIRKAFIYFLEAIAPLITLLLMKSRLAAYVILFVDNQAALAALQKGYGKDEHINNLVSVFWGLVSALNLFIVFSETK